MHKAQLRLRCPYLPDTQTLRRSSLEREHLDLLSSKLAFFFSEVAVEPLFEIDINANVNKASTELMERPVHGQWHQQIFL